MPRFLIITNGSSAIQTLRLLGLDADFVPWDDVLHEGPVRHAAHTEALTEDRAAFLSGLQWGAYTEMLARLRDRNQAVDDFRNYGETVLWFERDVYDQLQLLEALARLSHLGIAEHRASVIHSRPFITSCRTETNRDFFEARRRVSEAHLEAAVRGWSALCSPEPERLRSGVDSLQRHFPFMQRALCRFFDEYPSRRSGLGRSHRTILDRIHNQALSPLSLFKACQETEADPFVGDWMFWHYVRDLEHVDHPAIRCTDGGEFLFPPARPDDPAFREQILEVTAFGRAVISGRASFLEKNRFSRWLGGVHLHRGHYRYWDARRRQFLPRSA